MNSRHPDPRRVWKVGSEQRFGTSLPGDPRMNSNSSRFALKSNDFLSKTIDLSKIVWFYLRFFKKLQFYLRFSMLLLLWWRSTRNPFGNSGRSMFKTPGKVKGCVGARATLSVILSG